MTDFNGVSSEPDVCTVNVIPDENLYIAMSWDTNNSDIDLHLVPSGNTVGRKASIAVSPPLAGHTRLRAGQHRWVWPRKHPIDSRQRKEFLYSRPLYSDRGGGETEVTISIYIDGVLTETRTKVLPTSGHRWKVGYVSFDGPADDPGRVGTFVEEDIVEPYGSRSCPDC